MRLFTVMALSFAGSAWRKLQGESNQVSEPAFRHRVLVRKQAVIGIETELMPMFHGPRQNRASEFARGVHWKRIFKEDPYMAAISGT